MRILRYVSVIIATLLKRLKIITEKYVNKCDNEIAKQVIDSNSRGNCHLHEMLKWHILKVTKF